MRYQSLGSTGMQVTRFCLGTMMFGGWGNPDHDDSIRIIHAALDSGINFVDTADVYARGESEEIVAKALYGRRDNVILATKVHNAMGDDINMRGSSRRWITKAVDDSLRRLNTDWIDLYQVHRPDPNTRIDETLGVLTDLVRAGKIRAFGSSLFPADKIVESHWAAERHGLYHFQCEQSLYSIFTRTVERAVFPTCQAYDMGVMVYSPLDGGWLSGRFASEADIDLTKNRAKRLPGRWDPTRPTTKLRFEILAKLRDVASDAGLPLSHLAMAFTTAHPAVTATIIGPRTMEHLKDTLESQAVELDDETLDRIDEIMTPGSDVGGDYRSWQPPSITNAANRRRPAGSRAAT